MTTTEITTGELLTTSLVPGSPEWLAAGISSSRVAAIVGKSYWSSKFEVWHQMAGNLPYEGSLESKIQRRGRILEPAIATWFAEEHPEFAVNETGTWCRPEDRRLFGSPDRLAMRGEQLAAVVECKTAIVDDEYGPEGSAKIPEPYYVQAQWEMFVTGTDVCYVPVLHTYLNFALYVVPRDEAYIANLRAEAVRFLDTLPGGKNYQLPPIDGHEATYAAIRKINPAIQDGDVIIPAELGRDFLHARQQSEEWEKALRYYKSEIANTLGPFKTAVVKRGDNDYLKVAARRMAKGGPTLYKGSAKLEDLASIA